MDSETNDFAGSKNKVAQKSGLTKDGEWAETFPPMDCFIAVRLRCLLRMEEEGLSLAGAVSLVPKPVIDGWRELSDSVRSCLGSAVRDISFWFDTSWKAEKETLGIGLSQLYSIPC